MFLKKIDESFCLTLGMAERLGVDVTSTVSTDPEMNAIALRSAVFKCTACKQQKAFKSLQPSIHSWTQHRTIAGTGKLRVKSYAQLRGRASASLVPLSAHLSSKGDTFQATGSSWLSSRSRVTMA